METKIARKDVYQIVTERIMKQLEKGTVPWKQSWTKAGIPRNLITERPYKGLNVWLLSMLNYPLNLFLTYKQLVDIGGEVKPNEIPAVVIYWQKGEKEDKNNPEEKKDVYLLRYYKVYNIEQCIGIPEKCIPVITYPNDPIFTCEEMVRAMPNPPKIGSRYRGAFYNPVDDYLNMPKLNQFYSVSKYYGVLFHELVHSTGHESRLNRKELTKSTLDDGKMYSIEELTAELGASFLSNHAGIIDDEFKDNASYIAGWLHALKNNSRYLIYASAQAQKAVDYILGEKSLENE